jgi:hypothetical protein
VRLQLLLLLLLLVGPDAVPAHLWLLAQGLGKGVAMVVV